MLQSKTMPSRRFEQESFVTDSTFTNNLAEILDVLSSIDTVATMAAP
jgi:hypothetical protein